MISPLLDLASINMGVPVNWAHPCNRGLRQWLKVLPQTQQGLRALDLTYKYNGTLVGGASITGNRGRLSSYGAYLLDGVNDYIDSNTNIGTLAPTDGTVSFWAFHHNAFNSGLQEALFDQFSGSDQFVFLKFSDSQIYAGFNSAGGGDDRVIVAASSSNWPTRVWIHYTLTWVNTGTTTLYVNGVSIGTKTNTSITNPAVNLRYGHYYFNTTYYNGLQDDIRVSNRALSAAEVKTVYNESQSSNNRLLNYIDVNFYRIGARSIVPRRSILRFFRRVG